jgi:hypothetical protein
MDLVLISEERPRTAGEFDQMAGSMVRNLHAACGGRMEISPACTMARALQPLGNRLAAIAGPEFQPDVPVPADLVDDLLSLKATHYDPYIN